MIDQLQKYFLALLILSLENFYTLLVVKVKCQEMNQYNEIDTSNCLGPPFIYITLHDGVNVLKYSRNGCLLLENILENTPANKHGISEFRSMAIGKFKDEKNALYLVDADSYNSNVNIYSNCNSSGKREYITTALSAKSVEGMIHTYGIVFDKKNNIYISNQHTDNILRFYADTFKHMKYPPAINDDRNFRSDYYYKGTFIQFGYPSIHKVDEQGIRSIIIVNNELWVANMDFKGIVIINLSTGVSTNIVIVGEPIGLFFDELNNFVFVTCKGKHRTGVVYAIDPTTLRISKEYHHERLEHPTGVVSYENKLYVAEQILSSILIFDVHSTNFIDKIKHIPGEIEQIALSNC